MNFTFPKIGLRTIKTALAVFLCLLLFPSEPFFACITAVFCIQDTVSNSINMAINRGLGTVLGAITGLLFLIICRFFTYNIEIYFIRKFLVYLTIAIGIIVVIYLCNLIKKTGAINISCIAFLAVTTVRAFDQPIYYAVNRTIETLFGIFIALLINKFVAPPQKKA